MDIRVPLPVASALDAIGNTPVVRLRRLVPHGHAEVFVKLEYFNPTGSYKDRMALAMIEGAERRGLLRPGMTVVEYTGGSTGSSLAFVCAVKGYRFRVVSSDAFSPEKLKTMTTFGAELDIVPSASGRIGADLACRVLNVGEDRVASAPNKKAGSKPGFFNCYAANLRPAGSRLPASSAGRGTARL